MAAEVISLAFLQSVLRGLQRSPAVITEVLDNRGSLINSAKISCLVIPEGCIGLPTLSALLNGIPVVVVQGNTNRMRNNLSSLPWRPNQFFRVANYLEAAGVVAALRAGIDPRAVERPLLPVAVDPLVAQSDFRSSTLMSVSGNHDDHDFVAGGGSDAR